MMNRPKEEDYSHEEVRELFIITKTDYYSYSLALERYIDKLEKSLDKACKKLGESNVKVGKKWANISADKWKEWCMKDGI